MAAPPGAHFGTHISARILTWEPAVEEEDLCDQKQSRVWPGGPASDA